MLFFVLLLATCIPSCVGVAGIGAVDTSGSKALLRSEVDSFAWPTSNLFQSRSVQFRRSLDEEVASSEKAARSTSERPPERLTAGPDTLVALATYKHGMPLKYVKSARMAGFDGHIILGVSAELDKDTMKDLVSLGVTAKAVEETPCQLPYEAPKSDYMLRVVCSKEHPSLKLESARFALAKTWLEECTSCTGWVLVSDFDDLYFQRSPFAGMGRPSGRELIFQEEYYGANATDRHGPHNGRGVDNTFWFTHGGAANCYGEEEANRMGATPALNSGSIVGGRAGMIKFLARYQKEFELNVDRGVKCDPNNIADQATLNYLFYTGAFADLKPTTAKYGSGSVQNIGMVCTKNEAPGHSATDLIRLRDGWVLDQHGEPANAVHQDKVCWINLVLPYVETRFAHVSVEEVLSKFDDSRAKL